MEEKDPKEGFNMVGASPPPEDPGASLGMFLPRSAIEALNKLPEEEHKFLQSLLERLSVDMQAMQTATSEEDMERMMSTIGNDLATAVNLKSLEKAEAEELAINMVSAVAASGTRCLFLTLLNQAKMPEEEK